MNNMKIGELKVALVKSKIKYIIEALHTSSLLKSTSKEHTVA